MDKQWLTRLLEVPELQGMGHGQSAADLNLGLGWLYYAEVRLLRPSLVVCIGSWRGFAPLVLAKGLQDNADGGRVVFIDPSLVDDFWTDAQRVRAWFARFGVDNIDHHALTTQQFVQSPAFAGLASIGILFIDGLHTAAQARIDHQSFAPRLSADATVFFHDSIVHRVSRIYGEERAYEHSVVDYIDELKQEAELQVTDHVHGSGLSVVRRRLRTPRS